MLCMNIIIDLTVVLINKKLYFCLLMKPALRSWPSCSWVSHAITSANTFPDGLISSDDAQDDRKQRLHRKKTFTFHPYQKCTIERERRDWKKQRREKGGGGSKSSENPRFNSNHDLSFFGCWVGRLSFFSLILFNSRTRGWENKSQKVR